MTLSQPVSSIVAGDLTVAVLIDGENIAASHARAILKRAGQEGVPRIRRVFGNAGLLAAWDAEPGVDRIHTHSGKNSADVRLAIDAVDLAARGRAQNFVIASSDGDFTHLARYLREHGFHVTGVGGQKTPEAFRQACSWFVFLPEAEAAEPAGTAPEARVRALIKGEGEAGAMKICVLGARMKALHDLTPARLDEANWRAFLTARPHMFSCDPKGPNARVWLKSPAED